MASAKSKPAVAPDAGSPAQRNRGKPPRIEFGDKEWAQIQQLCLLQCTGEEIASVVGCSYDTLDRRVKEEHGISCAEYIKKHAAGGKASLRRSQFNLATKSAAMAIWLGKQYLGQREPNSRENVDVEDSGAVYDAAGLND